MANFFDQFDPAPKAPQGNYFDQFDAKSEGNYFDQFDPQPKKAAPTEPEVYPRATVDSSVTDPAERAAARLRAPYAHPQKEGTAWQRATEVIERLGKGAQSAIRASETQLDPTASEAEKRAAAGEVFSAASLGAPTSPAMGTGRGIARAIMQQHPAAKAEHELGVQIPTAVERGGWLAPLMAKIPGIGTPLRASAQRAERQLARAGEEAGTLPAGRAVDPEEAGLILRRSLRDADLAAGAGSAIAHIPGLSNEAVFNTLVNSAKSPEGAKTIFSMRSNVAREDWKLVQGALTQRLGQKEGVFDPTTFTQAYGKMSEQARNAAFGGGPLKKHLDTLEEVTRKYVGRLEKMSGEPMRGLFISPLSALTTVIGVGAPRLMASHMARPSSVASMASWAKSYDRLLEHPSPTAVAALSLATRNLSNNLDNVDIDFEKVLKQISESLPKFEPRLD